ncbi:lipid-binding SYLF domain-containing protein [Cerasicoccus maritimus]|uniref:lipid-binding SYLF domain-containing protein n=1 Tax=Cerasicoccus maritimus TaxID=490089 RepID=UPI002852AD64|nr:lipid-binding SYLF domain-containing protein [Cerasicoccus maritimus]
MKPITTTLLAFSLIASAYADGPKGPEPKAMDELIVKAESTVNLMQASKKSIPAVVLQDCKGLAIASVTRGGIGIGGQKGEGIVIAKTDEGWSAPSAFDTGGGSLGLQLGVETVQYVYVLNTDAAILSFTGDKVELDAKASATAGPDHAAAANDKLPKSDIYIYALTDGAFAGATVGGVYVKLDIDLNNQVYSNIVKVNQIISGEVPAPPITKDLYDQLDAIMTKGDE